MQYLKRILLPIGIIAGLILIFYDYINLTTVYVFLTEHWKTILGIVLLVLSSIKFLKLISPWIKNQYNTYQNRPKNARNKKIKEAEENLKNAEVDLTITAYDKIVDNLKGKPENMMYPVSLLVLDAERRGGIWFKIYTNWQRIFWFLGVIGTVSATVSASKIADEDWSSYLAIVSAVCLAIIGYLNPQREAYRHIRAWRLINDGVLRYKYDDKSQKAETIIEAMRQGENVLSDGESINPPK